MALVRGADVLVEYQPVAGGAWTDMTCEVTSADWQWGATVPMGPLTVSEGGSIRISLFDPDRTYDPNNASSPLAGVLKQGMPLRVRVDGSPAWTGALQTWGWDHDSGIADMGGIDPIGQLSLLTIPGEQTNMFAENNYLKTVRILDWVAWPAGARYLPTPSGADTPALQHVKGSALDELQNVTMSELGQMYARRDGALGWHNRAGPTPPAVSATINCGGASLTDMVVAHGLGRVRNRAVLGYEFQGTLYGTTYAVPAVPIPQQRTVLVDVAKVPLEHTDPAWANALFTALGTPRPMTVLGTILPEGAQVAPIVNAEYGARWTVATETESRTVRVLGMRVTLAPRTLEVDAVVEDV